MSLCFQEWPVLSRFPRPVSILDKSAFCMFEFSSSTFWSPRAQSKELAEAALILTKVLRMLIETEKGVSFISKLSPDFLMIERTESQVDIASIVGDLFSILN